MEETVEKKKKQKSNFGFKLINFIRVIGIVLIVVALCGLVFYEMYRRFEKSASKASARAFVEAASNAVITEMMSNPNIKITGSCKVKKDQITCNEIDNGLPKSITLKLYLKGDLPTGDTITFGEHGSVSDATLIINRFKIVCKDTNCKVNGNF